MNQFRTVTGYPTMFKFFSDNKTGDILEKQERDFTEIAQLNEMSGFNELSEKRIPLLAIIPTGMPMICAKPVTMVVP